MEMLSKKMVFLLGLRQFTQNYAEIMKTSEQTADSKPYIRAAKGERTAIQYLNKLPFWSRKGEEGIDTLGDCRATEIAMK